MEMSDQLFIGSSDDSGVVLTPGIEIEELFKLLNNESSDFCEIQSKPVKESPPTSLKHTNMTLRTNVRQHLMREQAYIEEQKRRQEEMKAQQQTAAQSLPSQPLTISTPVMQHSEVEVPAQVLQVRTRLKHPTQLYVKQCKIRQVKEYLNENSNIADEENPAVEAEAYSLPVQNVRRNRAATISGNRTGQNATAPVTYTCFSVPDSPQSVAPGSSVATSVSDVDLEVLTLDNDGGMELIEGQLGFPSTLPNFGVGELFSIQEPKGKTSTSCPADLPPIDESSQVGVFSPADLKAINKDRQKKDNHNMIERRRRCKINDQIKELGKLLPNTGEAYFDIVRDVRRHKGTILTASVSLIKRMKSDVSKMPQMEEKIRQLEQNNRKQLLRIQELETFVQNQGLPLNEPTWQAAPMDHIMHMIKQEPTFIKCENVDSNDNRINSDVLSSFTNQLIDEDDYTAIISDPMLSSPPEGSISSNLDDALSPESMDFNP